MPSKRFNVAPSVADTLTVLAPNPYQMPPGDWVIYEVRVAYGNVVNAKTNSGFIHIETTERSYDLAYGNGTGGATNTSGCAAEKIKCAIHAGGNTSVRVYVLDAYAHITEEVSLSFKSGGKNNFKTMAAGGVSGNGDTVALTEESFSTSAKLLRASLIPENNGRIYQIRYSGASIVDAKSSTGYIKLLIAGEGDPYEFVVGSCPGGATLGAPAPADVIDIPEGIPVKANSTIDIKITTLEACIAPHISLSYW